MIVTPYMKDRIVEAFSTLGIVDDAAVRMAAVAKDISLQTDDTNIWVTMTYRIAQEALNHLSQPPAVRPALTVDDNGELAFKNISADAPILSAPEPPGGCVWECAFHNPPFKSAPAGVCVLECEGDE